MDATVRRLALRAAAKVALTVTALGCSAAPDPSTTDETSAEALSRHHDAGTQHECDGGDTTAACADAPAPGQTATIDDATYACCKDMVVADEVDGSIPKDTAKDPAFLACCNALVLRVQQKSDEWMSTYPALRACCRATNDWSQPACTPWGPPAPPPALVADAAQELIDLFLAEVA